MAKAAAPKPQNRKKAAPSTAVRAVAATKAPPVTTAAAKKTALAAKGAPAKTAPAKKAVPAKKTVPAPAGKAAPAGKGAPAKGAPAKGAPAKKAAAKKAPAKKAAPAKKTAPAAKATPAKKAPVKKAAPAKKGAPANKVTPAKKAAAAKAEPVKKAARKPTTVICPLSGFEVKPEKPGLSPKTLERLQTSLLEERARHVQSAADLAAEAEQLAAEREGGDTQFDEESGEGDTINIERERDLLLSASAQQIVDEIDRALARIKNGTYGLCVPAGRRINLERLEALPYAETCVDCKARAERRR
jgi:RNA polymerase-binding transcription factor DksA